MQATVGKRYRLTVPESCVADSIGWHTTKKKPLFSTWGEISGREIEIKAATKLLTKYLLATLVDYPEHKFYVPGSFLSELTKIPGASCNCESLVLLNRGCLCGAFKKERDGRSKR